MRNAKKCDEEERDAVSRGGGEEKYTKCCGMERVFFVHTTIAEQTIAILEDKMEAAKGGTGRRGRR